MFVSGKFEILVNRAGVHEFEQLATAHCDRLFGGGEAAVVAEDAPNQTRAQQHVGTFQQGDIGPLLGGG